jgi:UDP-2-acetamido-2,6-beta-L-arabino-hexul-4-ose reductase
MKSSVLVEEVRMHTDARGVVLEPVNREQLALQRNAHLVITQPGGIRGNHCHPRGSEVTVLLGPVLLRVRERGNVREFHVPAGKALRFTFPPGVAHAYQNTGTEPLAAMAFNTEVFDPAHPDTVREVLIPGPEASS